MRSFLGLGLFFWAALHVSVCAAETLASDNPLKTVGNQKISNEALALAPMPDTTEEAIEAELKEKLAIKAAVTSSNDAVALAPAPDETQPPSAELAPVAAPVVAPMAPPPAPKAVVAPAVPAIPAIPAAMPKMADTVAPPSIEVIQAQKDALIQAEAAKKAGNELKVVDVAELPQAPAPRPVADNEAVADGKECVLQEKYDNIVRKVGLLENEKEKLRKLVVVAESGPLQTIMQCAAETNEIKSLKTENEILRKENEGLRQRAQAQDDALNAASTDGLSKALSELDDVTKGDGKDTKDVPVEESKETPKSEEKVGGSDGAN